MVSKPGSEILGNDIRTDREYEITTYDFKRPEKLSKEQIRTLSLIHETFCGIAMTSLSERLRSAVEIQISSVDQIPYEEFVRSVSVPSVIGVVNMDPLKGMAVLDIEPSTTFALVDRLLGGKGEELPIGREISEIECGLIEGIFIQLLGSLRESWTPVIDLRPRLAQIETIPQYAQIVPPTEMVVLIGMRARIGDVEGMIRFCIPYITIEAIAHRFTAIYMYSTVKGRGGAREVPPELMRDVGIEAEVCVAGEKVSLKRIGAMKKGARIHLPGWKRGDAFVRAGGVPVLDLKRQSSADDSELAFAVSKPILNRLEFLRPATEEQETSSDRIEERIAQLSDEISRGFESLQKSIKEIGIREEGAATELESVDSATEPPEQQILEKAPFSSITSNNVGWCASYLSEEHPQLIAMILTKIGTDLASVLICELPDSLRVDVIRRIGSIDRVDPLAVSESSRALERKFNSVPMDELKGKSTVDTALDILKAVPPSVKEQMVEALEQDASDLANENIIKALKGSGDY
jgi:flagellar motor switch protein FliM